MYCQQLAHVFYAWENILHFNVKKMKKKLKKIIKNEIFLEISPKKQSPVKFFTHDYESELFELISPEINFHSTKHVNKQNVHYNDAILNNGNPQKRVNKYKLKLDYCD